VDDPDRHRAVTAPAALGFRAHTGWAALIAVGGPASAPGFLLRRRIVLCAGKLPEAAEVYHHAAEVPLAKAEELVRRAAAAARERARAGIASATAELAAAGYQVVAAGLVTASGRPLPELATIVRSHPMIHTAEGALYRQALAEACRVPVTEVPQKTLSAQAAARLRLAGAALDAQLAEAGRSAGRPWGKDEKESMLVAWLALAGSA
jgi:hypothetical protein